MKTPPVITSPSIYCPGLSTEQGLDGRAGCLHVGLEAISLQR